MARAHADHGGQALARLKEKSDQFHKHWNANIVGFSSEPTDWNSASEVEHALHPTVDLLADDVKAKTIRSLSHCTSRTSFHRARKYVGVNVSNVYLYDFTRFYTLTLFTFFTSPSTFSTFVASLPDFQIAWRLRV